VIWPRSPNDFNAEMSFHADCQLNTALSGLNFYWYNRRHVHSPINKEILPLYACCVIMYV